MTDQVRDILASRQLRNAAKLLGGELTYQLVVDSEGNERRRAVITWKAS